MATLTVPHHTYQECRELRDGVALAWRKLAAGAPWGRIKSTFKVVGMLRAMEVTHGGSGWHPHLHVLILTEVLTDDEAGELSFRLFERWAGVVERMQLGGCSPDAYSFERAEKTAAAGDYVAKWGCDSELVRGHTKLGRGANRSPWQLLADAADGDQEAARLFREYGYAFKGARQLTWSQRLRKKLGLEDATSDEDAAAETEEGAEITTFSRPDWTWIKRRGLEVRILEIVEDHGQWGLTAFLRSEGFYRLTRDPPEGKEAA